MLKIRQLLTFAFLVLISDGVSAQVADSTAQKVVKDSAIAREVLDTSAVKTKEIINEVVASKDSVVSEDKVEYLSQVTQFGFKNLFLNYTYNPTMPYDQQVNPYAENYMRSYMRDHSAYLHKLQESAGTYFNLIDGILSKYGLPHELKYLAVIESNLKSNALSSAGARGPWQFMDYTARGYGLRVDDQTDERTDYVKSTHAAARYLLKLYRDMDDWLLVIAAYNGGPGRVYDAMRKSGSRNFWRLQYYLPEESRNHVKKFIATHYVMENDNAASSGFYARKPTPDPVIPDSLKENLTSMTISGRFVAEVTAAVIEMNPEDFKLLNPNMNNVLSNGDDFELQLPKDKMELFQQKKNDILNKSVEALLNNAIQESRTEYDKKKSS